MRDYIVELFRSSNGKRLFVARRILGAPHRGKAVHQAQLWYWEKYHGALGPAHTVLEINDPYEEVRYGPIFNCGAKVNRLLPEQVIERVLKEANGELVRSTRPWRPHHAPSSVRRVKRRRDFGKFILPNLRQMKNGLLYYRITIATQKVTNGRRYRKRKYRDIRLSASSPNEAPREIEERGLHLINQKVAKRVMQSRSLAMLRERSHALIATTEGA